MEHDFSLEKQITGGVVQNVFEIKTDLHTFQCIFENTVTGERTSLEVIGFDKLSVTLDFAEDIVQGNEGIVIQSLIGFSYEKNGDVYLYCMKTDDYEISFESKNLPVIRKL